MPYVISGTDTSGMVTLRRDTVEAAQKKAAELWADGCWDIRISGPDGGDIALPVFDAGSVEPGNLVRTN